jgi:hypothetical protein
LTRGNDWHAELEKENVMSKVVDDDREPPDDEDDTPNDPPPYEPIKKPIGKKVIVIDGKRIEVTLNKVMGEDGKPRYEAADAVVLGPAHGSHALADSNAPHGGPFDPDSWKNLIDPHNPAEIGQIAAIQYYTFDNDLIWSIKGLALDRGEYVKALRDPDLDVRYAFISSLHDGDIKIEGSKRNNETIEVGEGGKATIDSGAGNDTVYVWHQKAIDFDGGAGNDSLLFDYRFGFADQPAQGVTIDLAAGTGTNPFGGKITIKNVENVTGQFGAANDLRGDGHANHLEGGTAADTLMGRGGNDTIHVTYGTSLDPRATVADGGTGKDTLIAELSQAAPFTGSGADLRYINTLDLENPGNNTGTFHGGTFTNFEIIKADASGPYFVFDFHGSEKGEDVSGAGSNDSIDGRGGDDIIFGGYAADQLTGGTGADRFLFRYATDSNATDGEDTITDFSHADGDKLDLSKIYGPKLDFIGSKNFDGHAGELHAVKQGGDTLVEADTNGDKHADLALLLNGAPKLVEGDFVL